MQKISLISVGKIKTQWISAGCGIFTERLKKMCRFQEKILPTGKPEDENERIEKALEGDESIKIILDETGTSITSGEFAQLISNSRDRGEAMTFVIGGAYGIDEKNRKKANRVICLSRMTFPHEIAKLVFLEQLYRAHTMIAGTGYHH